MRIHIGRPLNVWCSLKTFADTSTSLSAVVLWLYLSKEGPSPLGAHVQCEQAVTQFMCVNCHSCTSRGWPRLPSKTGWILVKKPPLPPLRLIELFTSHGSDMITNPTHKVKWKVKWFHYEVILCWCWTCIASVYQLMWSSLLFSSLALVSLVICRGGERERERCAVSWLSFTSGALVLAAGSSVFFVIPFFFFNSRLPGRFAAQQSAILQRN